MSEQITIILTKDDVALLEQVDREIIGQMNRVDLLSLFAEQQAEYPREFSPSVWDGLSASLQDLNISAGKGLELLHLLKGKINNEVAV